MGGPPAEERRSARTPVMLAAKLRFDAATVDVRVANVSATGALVFGEPMPSKDTEVVLMCGKVEIAGWIAWAGNSHAGINFQAPINAASVLPKRGEHSNLIVKDARAGNFKRPGFKGDQLSPEERRIVDEWRRSHMADRARHT